MNIRSWARTAALAAMLVLPAVAVPAVHIHAQDNGDEGIEIDCPFRGGWVVNGGYVIAKDAHGVYHRVFCQNGQWVDGGPILSYRAGQAPPSPVAIGGGTAIP